MTDSDDVLRKMGLKKQQGPPPADVKPEDVRILMFASIAMPTAQGGIGPLIMGLGSDERVYQYTGGDDPKWIAQK